MGRNGKPPGFVPGSVIADGLVAKDVFSDAVF